MTQPAATVSASRNGYELTEIGMIVTGPIAFEVWENLGVYLAGMQRGIQWYLGDWLIAGEKLYPDRYSQALDSTKLEYRTLTNMAWVARSISYRNRRPELSWSHHSEVASLPEDKQREWLALAISENLTVVDFRYRLHGGVVTGGSGPGSVGGGGSAGGPMVDDVEHMKKLFGNLRNDQKYTFLEWANDLMAG